MITKDQYQSLLPIKDLLINFKETGNVTRTLSKQIINFEPLLRANVINFSICYSCSGSIANAVNDLYNLMNEYEENNK